VNEEGEDGSTRTACQAHTAQNLGRERGDWGGEEDRMGQHSHTKEVQCYVCKGMLQQEWMS